MLEALIAYHQKQLAGAQSVLDTDGNLFSHEMRERARLDAAQQREFIRALEAAQAQLGHGAKYQHVQRGSTYVILGQGIAQSALPIEDNDLLVLYRDGQGRLFARPTAEFYDGRFEPVVEAQEAFVLVVSGRYLPCTLSPESLHNLFTLGDITFSDNEDYGTGLRGRYQLMGASKNAGQPTELNLRAKP